ncbi:MAG TPA: hypothetical protein VMZ06_13070, partial [Candidatus Bathyarchaeia archaeon]|nr:hypothetical protein [Candidatus Bathyarchaeia archaeon]
MFVPAAAVAEVRLRVQSDTVALGISHTGQIVGVELRDSGIKKAVRGETVIDGCTLTSSDSKWLENNGLEFARRYDSESCVLTERFIPAGDSIRWEIEIEGGDTPWTTEIQTRLSWPDPAPMFWTAWSDPEQKNGRWADPLVFMPMKDATWYYAAPAWTEEKPRTGYIPREGNIFCIPLATFADPKQDVALTLALSPEDEMLDLTLRTSRDGSICFSRLNHRIGGRKDGKPLRFAMNLFAHPADWRPALGWMARRYPAYFEPALPAAHDIAGCGAYSSFEDKLDPKFRKMAFTVNWRSSFDFPYMGMFIPPLENIDERWPRFMQPEGAPDNVARTSIKQMRDYAQRMRDDGYHVLSYFNVTEFGTDIKEPPQTLTPDDPDLWRRANDYLHSKIADGILYSRKDKTWGTWGGAIAMDPGAPDYQAFLIEQAQRHVDLLPAADGICIDRLDWLRFYNPRGDDGVSWQAGKPSRSLYISWHDVMSKLAPVMHNAGKFIFVNNHLKRIDLLRDVDGIYCEFAHIGAALNETGMLCALKPAIGWTSSEKDLRPDPDALFQRHLYMGVYPTAPLPQNDHTINPSEFADKYYLDYGPMLDAMRGKRWVLEPHAIEVKGGKAKANLFEVPGGYIVPVVFGGKAKTASIILRLPTDAKLTAAVLHPGEE